VNYLELEKSLASGLPNTSQTWAGYITHFTNSSELDKGRAIAEQALSSVDYTDEQERSALWSAYLTLEVKLGSKEKLKEVFARACSAMDSYSMHTQLLDILKREKEGREEDVLTLYESTLKKFRHSHLECWFSYAEWLYGQVDGVQKARELLQRALQCLDKKQRMLSSLIGCEINNE